MSPASPSHLSHSGSPDPTSDATNIYDTTAAQADWVDEEDDDDMEFVQTTDESEDVEFFDPSEDVEAAFHGIRSGSSLP